MPRVIYPKDDDVVASVEEIAEAAERARAFGSTLTDGRVRQIADGKRVATKREARELALLVIQDELSNSELVSLLVKAQEALTDLIAATTGCPPDDLPRVH